MSNDSDVLAAINAERFPDGQEVTLEAIFGNSLNFDEDGNVSGARAMMQVTCHLINDRIGAVHLWGRGGGVINIVHGRRRMTVAPTSLQCRHGVRRGFADPADVAYTKRERNGGMFGFKLFRLTGHRAGVTTHHYGRGTPILTEVGYSISASLRPIR